jgi:spermidine dehydrogenase
MAIKRRDFLDGVVLAIGAGVTPASLFLAACSPYLGNGAETGMANSSGAPEAYPPRRSGMRGSHAGAFEVAHRLRDGADFSIASEPVEGTFDLVVVGAGISGLASAFFYRKRNPGARILLLDCHDDFGGHAKRNEFDAPQSHQPGQLLIGYGGSEALQSPKSLYSKTAMGLLRELGVDIARFETAFNRDHYPSRGMSRAVFFKRETFGQDKLVTGSPWLGVSEDLDFSRLNARPLKAFLTDFPLSAAGTAQINALFFENRNFWPGQKQAEVEHAIAHMSYHDFLRDQWHMAPEVIACFQNNTCDFFAVGIDGVCAKDAYETGYPGFQGLALARSDAAAAEVDEPYIYHFPDGNASIARLLVRKLIPGIAPGETMDDVVLARFDYSKLDHPDNIVRIRQSATVVRVEQYADGAVDIGYVRQGKTLRVRARACIMACYNMMIPYVLQGLEAVQGEALHRNVKGPLTYTNVLLRNWEAWDRLKVHSITNPSGFFSLIKLDYPVSMGGYQFSPDPSQPIIAHLVHVPTVPDAGPGLADKYRAGRRKLFSMTFADFEANIRDELTRILAPAGFDAEKDILAITVNRWSHGYAYYPTALYDNIDTKTFPQDLARRRLGKVAIAGSDAGWDAYAHTAIDQAWRAVEELNGPAHAG